jgi:RNA polymerase sigma factor (sigma-70 family)
MLQLHIISRETRPLSFPRVTKEGIMTYSQCTPRCRFAQLDHPPPFHPEQLAHAQAGCPECLDHLVRQNEALICWVLQRLDRGPLAYEEARQAGRIGLWKALLGFDPRRGFAFSTYAVVAIRRRIQLEGQRSRRFWRALPALQPTPPPDLWEQLQRSLLLAAVPRWVAQLPPRRAAVVRAYYGLGGAQPQLQRTIALSLGVTTQRVQQLLAEARLLLALPVYSWELRCLLERTSRREVQAALRAWHHFRQKQRRSTR